MKPKNGNLPQIEKHPLSARNHRGKGQKTTTRPQSHKNIGRSLPKFFRRRQRSAGRINRLGLIGLARRRKIMAAAMDFLTLRGRGAAFVSKLAKSRSPADMWFIPVFRFFASCMCGQAQAMDLNFFSKLRNFVMKVLDAPLENVPWDRPRVVFVLCRTLCYNQRNQT